MKIMLFTINAGGGHNACALALQEAFAQQGHETIIIDTLKTISPIIDKAFSWSSLNLMKSAREAYNEVYSLLDLKENKNKSSLWDLYFLMLANTLLPEIQQFGPQAIISTHVLPAHLIATLKKAALRKDAHTPFNTISTYGIITDYTIHPFWQNAQCTDYFVLADAGLRFEAIRKGIDKNKLLTTGIPIRRSFSKKTESQEAKRYFGLNQDLPAIMVMGGSLGLGQMKQIVTMLDTIDTPCSLISVCGSNAELKQTIDAMHPQNPLLNLGFTDQIPLLMDAADILITKPGGLTITEALTKELPMIFTDPLPAHEERNIEYLCNLGCALQCLDPKRICDTVNLLLSDDILYTRIKQNIRHIKKQDPTQSLCTFVLKQIEKNSQQIRL